MTREDFEGLVRRALASLRVDDQVTLVADAGATPDNGGAMTATLRIDEGGAEGGGGGRRGSGTSGSASGADAGAVAAGKTVTISVTPNADADAPRMESDTRAELRRALRMCPLCDRIGHVEKLRGAAGQQEGCVVRCPACGEFEIDQELVRRFRSARERDDAAVLDRLPSLSERTRAGDHVRITADNWRGGDAS
jgi:hypothetical protein